MGKEAYNNISTNGVSTVHGESGLNGLASAKCSLYNGCKGNDTVKRSHYCGGSGSSSTSSSCSGDGGGCGQESGNATIFVQADVPANGSTCVDCDHFSSW
ncbi:hypothetical protein PanWU01x14_158370 [Parasponia andersonii]|uniref:Uncharacterized protein n=1 Tax=Parasponia andersonii TaxID=3476 RepID=A0A2P5CF37_PARAD|nr:hypothetical protein PanWU01x14_158370 [Parasponia andersonii]